MAGAATGSIAALHRGGEGRPSADFGTPEVKRGGGAEADVSLVSQSGSELSASSSRRGPRISPSQAVVVAGALVPERRGGGGDPAPSGRLASASERRFDELEDHVVQAVSLLERQRRADRREADRLAEFASKSLEARADAQDRRQAELERRVARLEEGLAARGAVILEDTPWLPPARPLGIEELQQLCERTSALERRLQEALHSLHDRGLGLQAAAQQRLVDVEQRLQHVEELQAAAAVADGRSAPHAATASVQPATSAAVFEEAPVPPAVASSDAAAADEALGAVQELALAVDRELRSLRGDVHQRVGLLQETVDDQVLLPLKRIEQRMADSEHKVKHLLESGGAYSARLEEHEVRIGVNRTKLEVHDQKLVILDRALRWSRRIDGGAGRPGEADGQRPPSPTAPAFGTSGLLSFTGPWGSPPGTAAANGVGVNASPPPAPASVEAATAEVAQEPPLGGE